MTHLNQTDTITAISTPRGIGGIAIIRMSGPRSIDIITPLFQNASFKRRESHRAYHGWIKEQEEPIDEVIVTLFLGPHSYTGEDLVEIGCHGGSYISQKIIQMLIIKGARPARPGEFTERAFLSGRMDLSQAEAVADLIAAKTEASRRVAAYQLEGRLSEQLNSARDELIKMTALLELELDFVEEDLEFAPREAIIKQLDQLLEDLKSLAATFQRGRTLREGIRVTLTGSPNTGKSSLLNRLIERERAIVTDTPGTTRDTLEEQIEINGVGHVFTDTAGIRQTKNRVEREGVERALKAIQETDIVLALFDGSRKANNNDNLLLETLINNPTPKLIVFNKDDLPTRIQTESILSRLPGTPHVFISAKTGKGKEALLRSLEAFHLSGELPFEGEVILTRERHRDRLLNTIKHLHVAQKALKQNLSQEFIALDLRGALDALGDIVGATTTEDILNQIFSEFCVGK